jgi:integration host factor subunit alpha
LPFDQIMKQSDEVGMVSGFGKLCVKEKHERRGRNPATGEDMMLEPRRVVNLYI